MTNFEVLALTCLCNPEFNPEAAPEDYDYAFEVAGPDEQEIESFVIYVGFTLIKKNEGTRYNEVQIRAIGTFWMSDLLADEDILNSGTTSAISILYGAIRGYLASVMSAFRFGQITIPAVVASDLRLPDRPRIVRIATREATKSARPKAKKHSKAPKQRNP